MMLNLCLKVPHLRPWRDDQVLFAAACQKVRECILPRIASDSRFTHMGRIDDLYEGPILECLEYLELPEVIDNASVKACISEAQRGYDVEFRNASPDQLEWYFCTLHEIVMDHFSEVYEYCIRLWDETPSGIPRFRFDGPHGDIRKELALYSLLDQLCALSREYFYARMEADEECDDVAVNEQI